MIKQYVSEDKVSVVIPTYNRTDLLRRALKSVLRQSYANLEIIIVDDGSEFSPKHIIAEFNDNRVRLYCLEHGNANIARNYGIKNATGKYIAMLDNDDIWFENHIEDCLSMIEKTGADGIYGSLFIKKEGHEDRLIQSRELYRHESMADYLLSTVFGAQTSTLFTTSQSSKDVLWDPDLISHQDYDFVIRFSKKYKMIPKIEPSVAYYAYSDSLSSNVDCNSYEIFAKRYYKDINPRIYYRFCLDLLSYAKKTNQKNKYIKFFRKEAVRYKEFLTYQVYISICNPKTKLQSLKYKIRYISYILFVKLF